MINSRYSSLFSHEFWLKKGILFLFLIGLCSIFTYISLPYLSTYIARSAIMTAEESLGNRALSPEKEAYIRAIAQEMQISAPFVIRAMNPAALKVFSYHNAFVSFPKFALIVPTAAPAFLHVSDGFFEDLTSAEQRFLIGHELSHLKEEHTKYLFLIIFLVEIVLFMLMGYCWYYFWWPRLQQLIAAQYRLVAIGLIITTSFFLVDEGVGVAHNAYLRHCERVADYRALQTLHAYDGFLALLKRWQSEYQVSSHTNYGGIFSSHPSIIERKEYCVYLQSLHKGSHENS